MNDDVQPLVLPEAPDPISGRAVRAWRQSVVMGTYDTGEPMDYPAYLSRRVYQGSSGAVYPLPFHEHVGTERQERSWAAVHLENEHVRLMLLPELGGRIHVGLDKNTGYDFFYRNDVIKPALVGLTGPWLAGGVEFNWPQHHRPATYLPTSCEIEEEADGAVTVWCSDHDPFTRMQGTHGVRLRPDSALIELRVRLTNRSETVQTFLWWANVAARVNDDYQSFFPTDVAAVADHAKRAVIGFPAADGTYYGVDYAARAAEHPAGNAEAWVSAEEVDGFAPPPRDDAPDRIDWYHNIPVPTSYMITGTRDDFFGGYDHGRRAGFVHWADHTIAPGKKQWTWGNAPFGHAWDQNLTDGPGGAYVELMAGVFTDNQPDFSFLAPGETRAFSQFWYPINEIGPVHQATRDLAVRLDAARPAHGATVVRVAVAATRRFSGAQVTVTGANGQMLLDDKVDLAPGRPFVLRRELAGAHDRESLHLKVVHEGQPLIEWQHRSGPDTPEVLQAATEPAPPEEIESVDELVVTGLHLAQYRHATRSPEPYWREALRRDPGDARAHTQLGLRAYASARYTVAVEHFSAAIQRQTLRNPNPQDSTASHMLGLALRRLGRPREALEAFGRAAWNLAWQRPAVLERARTLAARRTPAGDQAALELLLPLLEQAPNDAQVAAVTVTLLRRSVHPAGDLAANILARARTSNPLDPWTRWLGTQEAGADAQICLDLAYEARSVGDLEGALILLEAAETADRTRAVGAPAVRPLTGYVRADVLHQLDRGGEADAATTAARQDSARWCFVSRLDDIDVLTAALERCPEDGRAAALLAQWLYAKDRPEEALSYWQRAVTADPQDAVSWRNLGLGSFDVQGDAQAAAEAYDRALALRPDDARLLFERDQLDQRTGSSLAARLERLGQHRALVAERDDLTVEYADLLTATGSAQQARDVLSNRLFHPWEGGEGRVLGAWTRAALELAGRHLAANEPELALARVRETLEPPQNLGEARHPLANTAQIHLLLGDVLAALDRPQEARQAWQIAAGQSADFVDMSVTSYSDQSVAALTALRRLGEPAQAQALRERLLSGLAESACTPARVDYFATSLPTLLLFDEDPQARRDREDLLVRAQLALFDGDPATASATLATLLAQDPSHIGAALLAHHI
ncbi:DUF5107 domain-containing protein [Kineosporia babensis]|uniref:DUF5107 domain-containing protein n=1 Tax=Kineosporia babensis TaxID=499548 RepID=A0A9X1SW47_9ACTN|nr:DUF5107 domain-containing protein [Kineosporia babensis]